MLPFLLALAVAPWAHPLVFQPMPGWQTGASGNTTSAYVGRRTKAVVPLESTAWIATNVRYRDDSTADPPNATLTHLPRNGLIVWAVIYNPANSRTPLRLDLRKARHLACCEGEYVAGGNYDWRDTARSAPTRDRARLLRRAANKGKVRAGAARSRPPRAPGVAMRVLRGSVAVLMLAALPAASGAAAHPSASAVVLPPPRFGRPSAGRRCRPGRWTARRALRS
jgi:hypothetical protein